MRTSHTSISKRASSLKASCCFSHESRTFKQQQGQNTSSSKFQTFSLFQPGPPTWHSTPDSFTKQTMQPLQADRFDTASTGFLDDAKQCQAFKSPLAAGRCPASCRPGSYMFQMSNVQQLGQPPECWEGSSNSWLALGHVCQRT